MNASTTATALEPVASASVQNVHASQERAKSPPQVLLATAWVQLSTAEGRTFKMRALLDQGSTYSFISELLCQIMRTKRHRANLKIHCFGEKFGGLAKSCVNLSLAPCDGQGPSFPLTGYVYQKITSYAASTAKLAELWPHLRDLKLADPNPSGSSPIHVLIGADLYGSLLLKDLRQGPLGTPTAQLTVLGWILSGPTGETRFASDQKPSRVLNCVSCADTNTLLQKFWEDENLPTEPSLTEEDERCESHFVNSHQRDSHGRYVVRLPFKHGSPGPIGDTLQRASSFYSKMEKRLLTNPEIATKYHAFLQEYESMNHMEQITNSEPPNSSSVYIPHHFVLRESSSTTKLRVVFNASSKSNNGTSLNDHLMVGPKLQQDISAIILRWRQFCYVYTADIEKMFRQILVHPEDIDFQRILWRPSHAPTVQHYRLLTVTYGMAPAPYLAMRVLNQLALDEGDAYPIARSICENSIYVDDVLFGADTIATLRKARDQLITLLSRGGFPLRKWTANSPELLNDIPAEQRESSDLAISKDDTLKVLGLSWSPNEDSFRFLISSQIPNVHSKRSVLSFIAKLYDPLGWASPTVVTAKVFM